VESGLTQIVGVASAVQRRRQGGSSEVDRYTLTMRLEPRDQAGNQLRPVPVELRNHRQGVVLDGELVEAVGSWSHGTFRAKRMRNLTTGAEILNRLPDEAQRTARRVFVGLGIFFALFFVLPVLAFLIFVLTRL
jgi:hypothetical protein